MKWIEPPEKDFKELENRLWNAAGQLRANSNLTAAQYSEPVLGLIVLRFADTRFSAQRSKPDETAFARRRAAPAIDDPRASAGDDGRWSLRLDGVADGRHAYVATATDATGNVSAASAERVVAVDTIAPAAPTVTTSFAGTDASFGLQVNLEISLPCRATLGLEHGRRVAARRTVSVNQTRSTKLKLSSPTRKALARVKWAALTLTVSAPDAKRVTRNVTLTRG